MSGTSLDGLDLAFCRFEENANKWNFEILKAQTIKYSSNWHQALSNAQYLSAIDFIKLHKDYGKLIGLTINEFVKSCYFPVNFIASHGHTVFHQPNQNLTFQIGDGAVIAATTGITTISDFRTLDVALGGQGAPLVPIGDRLLFADYDYCVNLGGFANLSFDMADKRYAFDICPVNIVANYLVRTIGKEFDENGELGRSGKLNQYLINELHRIAYYKLPPPKSLSKEWLDLEFLPILNAFSISLADKLFTLYEHIAIQIKRVTYSDKVKTALFTGGGAKSTFLMETIQKHTRHQIIVPEIEIIDFKEALIFAFLGVLRYRNEINCLATVTGAKTDNIGGVIHQI